MRSNLYSHGNVRSSFVAVVADAELARQSIWGRDSRHPGELEIEYPPMGQLRVRRLVHRGAQRPVFKVPSVKLARVVQCESLLEVDMAMLLDASPNVTSYGEQPVTLRYTIDGEETWHVPDFVAICADKRIFIEVKYARDIDAVIRTRTRVLQEQLARTGDLYLLLTEEEIRKPHLVRNARQILRRSCHAITDLDRIASFERLRRERLTTLGEWSWDISGAKDAIAMAHLLLRGQAQVDMTQPLGRATPVVSVNSLESKPWLLALSA